MPAQDTRVLRLGQLCPVECRSAEGLRILRIRYVVLDPPVSRELLAPTGPDLMAEVVAEVGEELPGRRGSPLLAHEQHRCVRTGQEQGRATGEQPWADLLGETIARGAVADLVMRLQRHDEPP